MANASQITTETTTYKLAKGMGIAATGVVVAMATPNPSAAEYKLDSAAMLLQQSYIAAHNQSIGAGWYYPVSPSDFSGFKVENSSEIISFLTANNIIIPKLQQIRQAIAIYFPQKDVSVELYTDPEISNCQRLFFNVQIDTDYEQASDKLHRLWEEWAYSHVQDIWDNIFIDVEYV